jgi:hypothetical protein
MLDMLNRKVLVHVYIYIYISEWGGDPEITFVLAHICIGKSSYNKNSYSLSSEIVFLGKND